MSQSDLSESEGSLLQSVLSESDCDLSPTSDLSQPSLLKDEGFSKLELPGTQEFPDGSNPVSFAPKLVTNNILSEGNGSMFLFRKVLDVEKCRNGFRVKVQWEAKDDDGRHSETTVPMSEWTTNRAREEALAQWVAECPNPEEIIGESKVWCKITKTMKQMGLSISNPKKTSIRSNRLKLKKKTKRKPRGEF